MSYMDQIAGSLLAADSELSAHSARLDRECVEINNTISKAQRTFGNQQPGVAFVNSMYKTIQSIVKADSALHLARQDIKNYILVVKK